MIFYRRFALVHSPDFGPARSLPQQSREFGKLRRGSNGVHLHAAVIVVSHPASDTEGFCRLIRKIPKPHALHAPAYPKQFGDLLFGQGFLVRGYTTIRRNSTMPRLPCSRIGPGSASLVSSAMPVGPSMLCRLITRMPFKITVTSRPTRRTTSDCHSPAGFSALRLGAMRPRIEPVPRLEGGRSASSAICTS